MRPPNRLSEFRKWKINPDHYSLENEKGEEIFVEPRLLKLLDFLVTNANKVVKRDELVAHVWEEVIVTEESLSKAIFDLRKFLAGNFRDHPNIITIRKVGYKLEFKPQPTRAHRALRLVARAIVYILIFVVTFSIVVRAIRYEN